MLILTLVASFLILIHTSSAGKWRVPNEDDELTRIWMGFPRSAEIWGKSNLAKVQVEWSNLVRTIAKYKPVNALCDANLVTLAKELTGEKHAFMITYITTIPYDDMWLRDSGCVFRHDGKGGLECVKLNFNGWGDKQTWDNDGNVADHMAEYLGIPLINTDLHGEGGAVITDGNGTLIANWASWYGNDRNPGKSRKVVADKLIHVYGAKKMIWFDGVVDKDIADDHIDSKLAFIGNGKLMLNWPKTGTKLRKEAKFIMDKLTHTKDTAGRQFKVTKVPVPRTVRTKSSEMLKSYLNFLVLDTKAVITAEFGDKEIDNKVRKLLSKAYPGRKIEMLNMDSVYEGGGGIHGVTQHEPIPDKL